MAAMLVNPQPGFVYPTIPDLTNSTRLLRLHLQPNTSEYKQLTCTLHNAAFPIDEPYEALSYEWGEPGDITSIHVNGQTFVIQQNLHDFLLEIVRTTPSSGTLSYVSLWVDAICINQNDEVEKTQQIRRIFDVYNQATRVLAWLGRVEHVKAVFFFDAIEDWLTRHPNFIEDELHALGPDADGREVFGLEFGRAVFISFFRSPKSVSLWTAMNTLMTCSYFSRLWIVQEIMLARELRFFVPNAGLTSTGVKVLKYLQLGLCDLTYQFSGEDCGKTLQEQGLKHLKHLAQDLDEATAFRGSGLMREWRGTTDINPLLELAVQYQGHKCRVVHDRLFAVLGLAISHQPLHMTSYVGQAYYKIYNKFEVSYNMTVLELTVYALLWCRPEGLWVSSSLNMCKLFDLTANQLDTALFSPRGDFIFATGRNSLVAQSRSAEMILEWFSLSCIVRPPDMVALTDDNVVFVGFYRFRHLAGEPLQVDDLIFQILPTMLCIVARMSPHGLRCTAIIMAVGRKQDMFASHAIEVSAAQAQRLWMPLGSLLSGRCSFFAREDDASTDTPNLMINCEFRLTTAHLLTLVSFHFATSLPWDTGIESNDSADSYLGITHAPLNQVQHIWQLRDTVLAVFTSILVSSSPLILQHSVDGDWTLSDPRWRDNFPWEQAGDYKVSSSDLQTFAAYQTRRERITEYNTRASMAQCQHQFADVSASGDTQRNKRPMRSCTLCGFTVFDIDLQEQSAIDSDI